jgi:hypothetical protein
MTERPTPLVAALLWASAYCLAACASGSRPADPDAPVVKTWEVSSRQPPNCERYKTIDWRTEDKIAAEKECRLVEELGIFLLEKQSCASDKECVVVPAFCPFGCEGIPVAVSRAVIVKERLEDLRQRYDDYCRYKCDPVWRTACRNGRCVAAQ